MAQKKAIIIGCGIAGPSLAIALKHVGVDSEIFEALDSPSNFGILSFTSNAIHVLKMLDVFDDLKSDVSPEAYFYKHNGKPIKIPKISPIMEKYDIFPGIILRRNRIVQALCEKALSLGIKIYYGKKLTEIHEKSGSVTAVFEDGTNTTGDFLIGSDGPFSKTRDIILPDSPKPHYTGIIWTGKDVPKTVNHNLSPNAFHMTMGKQAYSGSLLFSNNDLVWWTNLPCPKEKLNEFKNLSEKNWREKLLELHKDDHHLVSDCIKSINDKFVRIPLYALPRLSTWHKNSICLIGDAVHTTLPYIGQGAAMALEDSITLALCIRDIPQTEQAFAKFQKIREKRVEAIVKTSISIEKFMTTKNPIKKFLRNLFLSRTISQSIKHTEWIFLYKLSWETKIK